MNKHFIICALLGAVIVTTGSSQASELTFTLDTPACQMPPGPLLPAKYYVLAKKDKEFRWVKEAKPSAMFVGGSGWERIDGSRIYDGYGFYKLDLKQNGYCDWMLISSAPLSAGGGEEILNTIYLGTPQGWKRIGASIPENMPDIIGAGKSTLQQGDYAFFSDAPLSIRDVKSNRLYIIGTFWGQGSSHTHPTGMSVGRYGYRIYTWDQRKNNLQELDKWEPGSAADQVYTYFKKYGALDASAATQADRLVKFNPRFEKSEFVRGCKDEVVLTRSQYFSSLCKSVGVR